MCVETRLEEKSVTESMRINHNSNINNRQCHQLAVKQTLTDVNPRMLRLFTKERLVHRHETRQNSTEVPPFSLRLTV